MQVPLLEQATHISYTEKITLAMSIPIRYTTNVTKPKKDPTYVTYQNMLGRCYYRKMHKYEYYGGRGIVVCQEWRNSFENFMGDMGPRPSSNHTIDRIDPDGNYEPSNCRWLPKSENHRRNVCEACKDRPASKRETQIFLAALGLKFCHRCKFMKSLEEFPKLSQKYVTHYRTHDSYCYACVRFAANQRYQKKNLLSVKE